VKISASVQAVENRDSLKPHASSRRKHEGRAARG
jgi:hypothetical protein